MMWKLEKYAIVWGKNMGHSRIYKKRLKIWCNISTLGDLFFFPISNVNGLTSLGCLAHTRPVVRLNMIYHRTFYKLQIQLKRHLFCLFWALSAQGLDQWHLFKVRECHDSCIMITAVRSLWWLHWGNNNYIISASNNYSINHLIVKWAKLGIDSKITLSLNIPPGVWKLWIYWWGSEHHWRMNSSFSFQHRQTLGQYFHPLDGKEKILFSFPALPRATSRNMKIIVLQKETWM